MRKISIIILLLLCIILPACTDTQGGNTTEAERTKTDSLTEDEPGTQTDSRTNGQTSEQTDKQTDKQTSANTAENDTVPTGNMTEKPVISGVQNLAKDEVMVYGKCGGDCIITVNGTYTENLVIKSDGENFIFAVNVPKSKKDKLTLTAKEEGKEESREVTVDVKYDSGADNTNLLVTLASRIVEEKVLSDFYHDNLFNQKQLDSITKNAGYCVNKAREASGKDTQIIYVIAPNPLTVYPEEADAATASNVESDNSRLKQAVQALTDIDGVTVLDLTSVMLENKDAGKLYYKIDSHWTELGGYFGYKTLMDEISKTWKSAVPHPLSDYTVELVRNDDTDMTVYSGVGSGVMFEDVPYLKSDYSTKTKYDKNKGETARIWDFVNKYFSGKNSVTKINDSTLPRGLVLMDSYGLNMISLVSEHFSYLVTEPIWTHQIDYDLVSETKPDIIIHILSERSLSELLSAI